MEHLSALLRKKLSHPRFKEALRFGKIKKVVEDFFAKKGFGVEVLTFEDKTGLLTIRVSHPAFAREVLGYQATIGALCKRHELLPVKKLIIRQR